MAVNCCVAPDVMEGVAGVTAMETKVGGAVTVKVVLPETAPTVAEMVVVPLETAVAKPAVLMVATVALDESQFAEDVRFLVLVSL